ncbi:MAG: elongation factor P [Candidatus Hydrogenedentes bacterium]|nr:elongation factor P [Candidatus Hydrogenedentota bacterium]
MISTAEFRNGLVVLQEGQLMEIIEFQHVKPGKGGAFVRTKFKNVLSGRVIEKTFRSGEKMENVRLEEAGWQYLYHDGDLYHFMHPESYEQIPVGETTVGDNAKWFKENMIVNLVFHDGKVIMVKVPITVTLKITKCDPGIQGDRSTGGTKPATLETGAVVQVPLFVGEGETIKVDTRTSAYIERA